MAFTRRVLAALVLLLAGTAAARAQTVPVFVNGQIITAQSLNAAFAAIEAQIGGISCVFTPCPPATPIVNSSIFYTDGSGHLFFGTTLPSGLTYPSPIFTGTITGGTFAGPTITNPAINGGTIANLAAPLGGTSGGTGVNNGANTLTLAAPLTVGALATTNQMLYASAPGAIGSLATANNAVLVTSNTGVPSISTTLPNGLALGTPASGVLTHATGLPLTTGVTGTLPNGNTTATSANTASTIVARDASGNFSAGTITAALTGHASLDLALTGGTLAGTLTGADAGTWTSGGLSGLAGITNTPISGSTGAFTTLIAAGGVSYSWVQSFWANTTSITQSLGVSHTGQYGVLGSSRTSDNALVTDAIGLAGLAKNDQTSVNSGAWGGYLEGDRLASVPGPTQGLEVDIGNFGSTVDVVPTAMGPAGLTADLWLAAGGAAGATNPASVAIGIIDNGAKYRKGIVFGSTALDTSVGSSGGGVAMEMNELGEIRWLGTSSAVAGEIWSGDTTAALQINHPTEVDLNIAGTNIFGVISGGAYVKEALVVGLATAEGTGTVNVAGAYYVGGNVSIDDNRTVHLAGFTVSALPAGAAGEIVYVTDQASSCPVFGGTFTGSGSVKCLAFYNGSAWVGG